MILDRLVKTCALSVRILPSGRSRGAAGGGGGGGGAPRPPPLFLDQTEAGGAEKNFFGHHPPYLRVWMTAPPPPPFLKVWIRHCCLSPSLAIEKVGTRAKKRNKGGRARRGDSSFSLPLLLLSYSHFKTFNFCAITRSETLATKP